MPHAVRTLTLTVTVDTDRLQHPIDQTALSIEAAAQGFTALHAAGAVVSLHLEGDDGNAAVTTASDTLRWIEGPLAG